MKYRNRMAAINQLMEQMSTGITNEEFAKRWAMGVMVGERHKGIMDEEQYEEHSRAMMAIHADDVQKRNAINAIEFLKHPPKVPGEFFVVKANYLWHECTWHHLTLEAAFEDARHDCAPISITGPGGVVAEWHSGMTLEQVRFILDGNHVALSDGAL